MILTSQFLNFFEFIFILFGSFGIFGEAAMPFLCNGVLLDHFNLPRVIQVVFQMCRNIMLVSFICTISWASKGTESKMLCSYFLEETQLGLELTRSSYQSILQEESHTIALLSIQIDKYKITISCIERNCSVKTCLKQFLLKDKKLTLR